MSTKQNSIKIKRKNLNQVVPSIIIGSKLKRVAKKGSMKEADSRIRLDKDPNIDVVAINLKVSQQDDGMTGKATTSPDSPLCISQKCQSKDQQSRILTKSAKPPLGKLSKSQNKTWNFQQDQSSDKVIKLLTDNQNIQFQAFKESLMGPKPNQSSEEQDANSGHIHDGINEQILQILSNDLFDDDQEPQADFTFEKQKSLTTPFNYALNQLDSNPSVKQHMVKLNKQIHAANSNTPRSITNDGSSSDIYTTGTFQKLHEGNPYNSEMEQTFESPPNQQITGDRYICMRSANDDKDDNKGEVQGLDLKFETKIELFKIDHQEEEEQRKNNQLVCDHQKTEQTLQEIENKKTYQTLLQNQLLGIENENLLNEIHKNDENYMNKNLYTQMQIANDADPVQITQSEWNDNDCEMGVENAQSPDKNTGSSPNKQCTEHVLYSGPFAYTSPPERIMLSDNIYPCGSQGENATQGAVEAATPFSSKFTILKYNSDSQKFKNISPVKLGSKKKAKVNIFKLCQQQNKEANRLLDFKIPEPVMGKGIFNNEGTELQKMIKSDIQSTQNKVLKSQRTAASENLADQSFGIVDVKHLGKYENEENFNNLISRNSQQLGRSDIPSNTHLSNKENPQFSSNKLVLGNHQSFASDLSLIGSGQESNSNHLKSMMMSSQQNELLKSNQNQFNLDLDHNLQKVFQPSPFQGLGNPDGHQILQHKEERNIAKIPYKVLDAPQLSDDFYLNLVDWSESNNLAVGLMSSVYIWSASSSAVMKLHEYGQNNDGPASVCWSRQGGNYLATGTLSGLVQLWDTHSQKLLRTYRGHEGRVAALSWTNSNMLSTGSKDRTILNRDMRVKDHYISKIEAHKQEVCGIKWSFDDRYLASGGNDNKLKIWEANQQRSNIPLHKFSSHKAAVKAIAWSPHQTSIVASGGGTADRQIKFWNTQNGMEVQSVQTGSQVCSLMFSKSSNELVSTHGFQDNAVVIWKYPSMKKLATLTGHQYRVLYLAMSPDSETIVTGAGDETLRFWKVFPKNKNAKTFGQKGESVNQKLNSASKLALSSCFIR